MVHIKNLGLYTEEDVNKIINLILLFDHRVKKCVGKTYVNSHMKKYIKMNKTKIKTMGFFFIQKKKEYTIQ